MDENNKYDNEKAAVSKTDIIPSIDENKVFLERLTSDSHALIHTHHYPLITTADDVLNSRESTIKPNILPDFLVAIKSTDLISLYEIPLASSSYRRPQKTIFYDNFYPQNQKSPPSLLFRQLLDQKPITTVINSPSLLSQGNQFMQPPPPSPSTPPTAIISTRSQELKFMSNLDPSSISSSHGSVNVHLGSFANSLTRSLGADALTIGKNIFFSRGKYKPNTPQGIGLLIHELTHIKQQENNRDLQKQVIGNSQRTSLENEALANEKKVLQLSSRYEKTIHQDHHYHHDRYYRLGSAISNWDIPGTFAPWRNKNMNSLSLATPTKRISATSFKDFTTAEQPSFVRNRFSDRLQNMQLGHFLADSMISSLSSYNLRMDDNYDYNSNNRTQGQNYNTVESNTTYDIPTDNSLKYSTSSNQTVLSNSIVSPLKAESARSLPDSSPDGSGSSTETAVENAMPAPLSPSLAFDIDQIADKVYSLIERKIKMQREQRGFR
jgi:hypothetical protein